MTSKITKPSCMDCPYCQKAEYPVAITPALVYGGQCRRQPPLPLANGVSDWPWIDLQDLCGDHPNFDWWIKESKNET